MVHTEQAQFFALVAKTLTQYVKSPNPAELEGWWDTCRPFSIHDVERALKAHEGDEKDGKHAPRPIDVKRRLATVHSDTNRCSATDPTGRCEYPGISSDGTAGEGPWYCPWHRTERSGPEASAWIERSRNIPFEVARAKRIERMGTEAQRSPAVVATAWDMAHHGRNMPKRGNFADLPMPPQLEQTGTE